jgi:hypothetical protein
MEIPHSPLIVCWAWMRPFWILSSAAAVRKNRRDLNWYRRSLGTAITTPVMADTLLAYRRKVGPADLLPVQRQHNTVLPGAPVHADPLGQIPRLCLSLGVVPGSVPPRVIAGLPPPGGDRSDRSGHPVRCALTPGTALATPLAECVRRVPLSAVHMVIETCSIDAVP